MSALQDDAEASVYEALLGRPSEPAVQPWMSGLPQLDRALNGQVHPGGLLEVAGGPGAGVTTVLLLCAAAALAQGRQALYMSVETPLAPAQARDLGCGDGLLISHMSEAAAMFESLRTLIETKSLDLVCIDTVAGIAATTGQASQSSGEEPELNELLGRELPSLAFTAAKSGCTVLLGNQVRARKDAFGVWQDDSRAGYATLVHHLSASATVTRTTFGPEGRFAVHGTASAPHGWGTRTWEEHGAIPGGLDVARSALTVAADAGVLVERDGGFVHTGTGELLKAKHLADLRGLVEAGVLDAAQLVTQSAAAGWGV